MEAFLYFGIFILALLILLTTGAPVGVSLGTIGILTTLFFGDIGQLARLANTAFSRSSDFVFLVIPLFIFMGAVLAEGKLGEDLYACAQRWLGRLPGSLAIATIFAAAAFGSVCGSSPVTARTIGTISIPEMLKRGFDKRLALGATAAGGTLGIMIPPSVAFIVYGLVTETSVGKLFIAGILPGLLLAVVLSLTVMTIVWIKPQMAQRVPPCGWNKKFSALGRVWPIAALCFAVLGSIYFGIATASESAAIGALGSLLLAFIMGRMSKTSLVGVMIRTVTTTSMLMLILVGGLFASFVLSRFELAQGMAAALTSLPIGRWGVMILINVFLLVFGMFLDPMSIAVITLPVFFPTVVQLGFDPIWFGVITTLNLELAAISPPVGFNLFVLKGVVPEADMKSVITGSLFFIFPLVLVMVILSIFPQIALWLPSLMAS